MIAELLPEVAYCLREVPGRLLFSRQSGEKGCEGFKDVQNLLQDRKHWRETAENVGRQEQQVRIEIGEEG